MRAHARRTNASGVFNGWSRGWSLCSTRTRLIPGPASGGLLTVCGCPVVGALGDDDKVPGFVGHLAGNLDTAEVDLRYQFSALSSFVQSSFRDVAGCGEDVDLKTISGVGWHTRIRPWKNSSRCYPLRVFPYDEVLNQIRARSYYVDYRGCDPYPLLFLLLTYAVMQCGFLTLR